MIKRRYQQIAKLYKRYKRSDAKLQYHAYVVNAKWLALGKRKYIFQKSFFEGGD